MTPYLIQRGRIRHDETRKGLDALVAFDYMGSAEFEYGALNKSLKALRADLKSYQAEEATFGQAKFVVFSSGSLSVTLHAVSEIGLQKIRLKEWCDFGEWAYRGDNFERRKESRNNFWWDIENHFMWWIDQGKKMNERIIQAIRGEK